MEYTYVLQKVCVVYVTSRDVHTAVEEEESLRIREGPQYQLRQTGACVLLRE